MKNQRFYSALAFIFAIFFLFTACNNFLKANDPANYYIVIFETDGGTPIPRPQIVAQGGEVTLPAPVTRYGYVFGGWYRETACINPWNFFTDTVSNDTTLYVKWNPKFYTVNFNTNGGSLAPDPQNIAYGNKVIMPPPISNTGYGFGGWYKEKACINQWDFAADTITGNITLYALWDSNYYIVNFEANGGIPASGQQNIAHGKKVVKPPPMTNTGYGFGGWYKEEACINQWDFAADTITDNITLYALWDINYYTVNFNANGGNPVPRQQSIAYGNKVIMPPPISNTGYGFGGWYKEKACINQWNFDSGTISDNIILYDKWDIIYYTIDFNTNNGSPVPQQNVVHGGKITKPSVVNKTGYTFDGWYK